MSGTTAAKRKVKSAPHKTSALDALRASGMVGMFAGPADLASSRRRIEREKLRGKAGAAR